MKTNFRKLFFQTLSILVAGILLGALLLTLAYCVPVNPGSYYSSERSIELQGYYPNVPIISNSYNTYFQTFLPGVLDNNTVRTYMLPMTYETGNNPLYLAMNCRGYSYYWHGYVTVLRILQLFMHYEEIQLLNDFLQIALISILAFIIGQKKGIKYVIMLLSCYVLLMPMAISTCIQYSAVFYIAYGACLFLLKKPKLMQGHRMYFFFLIIGMMTSYFDLLTYPLITWGIPIVWWLIINEENLTAKKYLKQVILLGIAWIIGYGGMWFGKWILASIVLNKNIIVEALKEVLLRTSAYNEVTFSQSNRFYAIYMNWKHYNYKLYVFILLGWLCYWLTHGFFFGWSKLSREKYPAYLLIGCSSFAWYLVLMNHTQIHHAFTYRIFGISIAAFFAIVLESTNQKDHMIRNIRHYTKFAVLSIFLMIISIVLSLFAKEITQVDNKSYEFETRLLEEDSFRFYFVPKYDRILGLGIGLKTDSVNGWYEVSISDEDSILYTEKIPVTYNEGNHFKDYSLSWNLISGKNYTISVTPHEVTENVYIFFTPEGNLPMEGCQYYSDDSLIQSQPLLGIQYWCLPSSIKTLGLLAVTYWGLLWVVAFVLGCSFTQTKYHLTKQKINHMHS